MISKQREFHADFGEIPQSKGVPKALLASVAIGLIMMFGVAAGVVLTAGHGRPSISTLRANVK